MGDLSFCQKEQEEKKTEKTGEQNECCSAVSECWLSERVRKNVPVVVSLREDRQP